MYNPGVMEIKLPVVLAVLVGTLLLACSTAAPAPVEPTPNIDATVEARVAQERAVDATVEARLKEERASQPISIPSPANTQSAKPTYTPNPTYTPEPAPTARPTIVPTATSVPTPTPRPLPTATPVPTPIPSSASTSHECEGKTIKFKIGNVWVNESIVWRQGEVTELNLTASSAILPSTAGTSWPILARLSPTAQRVAPHAVLGSVNAADGTSISAWYGDTQLAAKNVTGGSYPVILIEDSKCVSITATSVPTPTATPEPGYALYINNTRVYSGDISIAVPYGTADLHQLADSDNTYRKNSWVNLSVTPTDSESVVRLLGGFQSTSGTSGSIYMDNTKWVTISITPPVLPTLVPTPTIIPTPSTSQAGGNCSYTLGIDQADSDFSGLLIRFKVGAMWANERMVWQQGGANELNLTVSSSKVPHHSIFSWPVSFKSSAATSRVLPQRAPPHYVVGSANASPGTAITAWIDGVEVASTNCS